MGFIIKATNIETDEEVLYARKSQKTAYINDIQYKYYVPVVDFDLKVYEDIVHCQMGMVFLQERLKQPYKDINGNIEWKDVWVLEMMEVEKPEG